MARAAIPTVDLAPFLADAGVTIGAPPTAAQKKVETKTANEAKRAWVEAQWIDVSPPPPGHEGPTPAYPPSHQLDPPAFVPPPAPRRAKTVLDKRTGKRVETGDFEPEDPVKDFEAAYKRAPTKGGPTLEVRAQHAPRAQQPAARVPRLTRSRPPQVLKKLSPKSGAFAFFSLFITSAMFKHTTAMSNQYASSVGAGVDYYKDWTPFGQWEVETTVGLLFRNGLHPVPDLELMFANPATRFVYGDTRVRNIFGPNSIRRWKHIRLVSRLGGRRSVTESTLCDTH